MPHIDSKKLEALREAWIDLPNPGQVPNGYGHAVQRLINAVDDIIDPERTMVTDPEVARRTSLATMRAAYEHAKWNAEKAAEFGLSDHEAQWRAKMVEAARACRLEHGLDLTAEPS